MVVLSWPVNPARSKLTAERSEAVSLLRASLGPLTNRFRTVFHVEIEPFSMSVCQFEEFPEPTDHVKRESFSMSTELNSDKQTYKIERN